ncbi:hypothetical protein ACFOHK_08185 [Falsigemmobacter intermedius]|uniref:Uncharacterized protein n=1 Tax=Falsigemmobacter intermedius TaxID=1553448 RepID=A0A3S3U3F3_9RHOB|nr:hypothetical protein [Falsigemmobacter intermedius]RWY36425.1 hypothetical protein EP867_17845 [Falsigemmobacter intermedius]
MDFASLIPFIGIAATIWCLIALVMAIFPGNRKRRLIHAGAAFLVFIGAMASSPTPEEMAAEKQAVALSEAISYEQSISNHLQLVRSFDANDFKADSQSIGLALGILEAAAKVYAEGKSKDLSEAASSEREQLRKALSSKQTTALPVLRDAYGPAMRKALWEADGKAKTFGKGYRTVEFVNVSFARNANIKQIHTELFPTLMKLRFTRAQYKWVDADVEYQYFTLTPPKDSEIVTWRPNGTFTSADEN